MNLNISTINVLPATPVQPVRSNLARGSAKTDSFDRFAQENSRISSDYERFGAKKWGGKSSTEGVKRRDDIQQSDNTAYGTRKSEEEGHKEDFENVLGRQLKPNESLDESGEGKAAEKAEKTDISAQNGELQTSDSLKSDILTEKQASDLTQEPKITNKVLGQIVSQTTESSLNNTPLATVENRCGNLQKNMLQQTEMTSNTASNNAKPGQVVPLATEQEKSIQQGEQQRQIDGTRAASPDGKQTSQNTAAIKTRSADDAGLGKLVESMEQRKSGGDNESVDFSSRQVAVQSKAQSAALSAETLTGNSIAGRVQEQITAWGQQGGVEAANNARVKDKTGSDSQKVSRQLPSEGQWASGISEKLNVEKAESPSGIINTPKSESGNNTAQNSPVQIGGFGSAQNAAADTSIIAGRAITTATNAPVEDTAVSVREQIYQSVKNSVQEGASQITIRLNPPELGQVSVKFSEQGKELTGLLEATNPQTRAEIRQAIPEIIRSLEESGVSIKRIDVMLSSDSPRQSAQQSLRDNASGDQWEQFSQNGFQDTGGNRPSQDSYVTLAYNDKPGAPGNDAHVVTSFGRNQAQSTDNLLDVLI